MSRSLSGFACLVACLGNSWLGGSVAGESVGVERADRLRAGYHVEETGR